MKRIGALIAAALVCGSAVAFARAGDEAKKTTKVRDLWTCPMSGKAVADKNAKSTTVGSMRVRFCCENCPEAFEKLSAEDKKARTLAVSRKMDVFTCPMSGKEVTKADAKVASVGNYNVRFCCDNCPEAFEKLSDSEKKTKAVAAAKVVDIFTCPMSGGEVKDKTSKSVLVGNSRVHFCCDKCPEGFAALSAEDKEKKVASVSGLTEVATCPISGGAVKDKTAAMANAAVIGNYRVLFCCENCPKSFDKLSDTEKEAKAEAAAKKEVK